MTRLLTVLLIVLVVIPSYGDSESVIAQTSTELGGSDLNCGHLLTTPHAEAVFEASNDPTDPDPYGLDGPPGPEFIGEENVPCEDPSIFDTEETTASCANFLPPSEGGQEHAQALYEASNGGEGYNLVAVGGVACSSETEPVPSEPIPSDLPSDLASDLPPTTTAEPSGDCDVEVRAGRAYVFTDCNGGPVEAGFEPFEGFDAFAERAQNGFGAFDDTDSGGTSSVEVQQAVPASGSTGPASRDSASSDTRLVEEAQESRRPKKKRTVRKAAKAKAKQRAKQRRLKQKRQQQLQESREAQR